MRSSSLWLAIAASSLASAARTPFSNIGSGLKSSDKIIPNAYIIELDSAANLKSIPGSRRALVSPHKELYKRLEERGVAYTVRKEFASPDIFTGVAVHLTDATDINSLAGIPGVKNFSPVRLWPRPSPVKTQVLAAGAAAPIDGESTHIMTGVDKLHAQGLYGKGVTVGIIDTGTDYTHPYLGGGFGKGFKVALGYDFVGDAYTGTNTPVPDDDPLDQCEGHGTHVAGIVGANPGNPYNFSGVAYEATIASYRVFGCAGSVPDDIIVAALLRAYNDGSDVITLSLGGPDPWTESVGGVVGSRIAKLGRIVTIAAGNEGASGAWYASGPGTGADVISVASVENTVLSVQTIITSTGYGPVIYNGLLPLALPTGYAADTFLPIYALSTDTGVVGDACDPLPASTPDLSGKVVLVRRGTCTFVSKLANIAAKGGKVSLIYDNIVEATFSPSTDPYVGVLISAADGEYLVGQFAAGNNVTVKFPSTGGTTIPSPDGGLVSAFSTYGPSYDMYFKPAVAAPGGNIVSTYPVKLGSYAVLSGTSMATPFVAGSAALLFQKHGKGLATAKAARTLFETTAVALPSDKNGSSPLQTLTQAGAGLIQVDRALLYGTTLTPGELLLNDTAHFNGIHLLTLKNGGSKSQTYSLEHVAAGTSLTIQPGSIQPSLGPVPLSTDYASVHILPSKVTLRAGATAIIAVTVTPPKTGDKSLFPVYSGFIQVRGSLGENLHSSYVGLNGKTTDLHVIDDSDYYFGFPIPALLNATGDIQTAGTKYTLAGDDVPTVLFRLANGAPALYADLVSANTSFTPTIAGSKRSAPEAGLFDRNWWSPGGYGAAASGTFAKVPIVGALAVYKYQPRSPDDTFENGGYNLLSLDSTFANGTTIPKGSYKVLARALKIAGDAKSESSYESWLSSVFTVV